MTTERPEISVLLLCHNEATFIRRAIRSVLEQTLEAPLEVILVDDGSRDESVQIVQAEVDAAARPGLVLKVVRHAENQGNTEAFVTGLSSARGRYFHVLDSDDYWIDADKLHIQLALLNANPDFAGVGHRTIVRSLGDGSESFYPVREPEKTVMGFEDLLVGGWYFHTSAMLFRNYYYRPESDDVDVPAIFHEVEGDTIRIYVNAFQGDIAYLPQTMSVYDDHGGGIWTALDWNGRQALLRNLQERMQANGYLAALDARHHGNFAAERLAEIAAFAPKTLRPVSLLPMAPTAARPYRIDQINRVSTLRGLEIQSAELTEAGQLDDALRLLSRFVVAITHDRTLSRLGFNRRYSSFEIDWHCARIGTAIGARFSVLPTAQSTATEGPVAIVVSGLAPGELTEQVLDMLALLKGRTRVCVVSTEFYPSGGTLPPELNEDVQLLINTDDSLEAKAAWLMHHLSRLAPSRIIALPARQDMALMAGLRREHAPEVHLLDVAEHGFGIGRHSNAVGSVIVRRPYDLAYLARIEPGKPLILIPPFQRGLGTDAAAPNPAAWSPGATVTATVTSARAQIEQAYDYKYDEMIPHVLQYGVARHLHFGDLSDAVVNRIRKAMLRREMDPARFRHLPFPAKIGAALVAEGVHVLLQSFPMPDARAQTAAMAAGLPVILHRSYLHPMLDLSDLCYTGAAVWAEASELLATLRGIDAAWLDEQRALCRARADAKAGYGVEGQADRPDLFTPLAPEMLPSFAVPETRNELRRALNELVSMTILQP